MPTGLRPKETIQIFFRVITFVFVFLLDSAERTSPNWLKGSYGKTFSLGSLWSVTSMTRVMRSPSPNQRAKDTAPRVQGAEFNVGHFLGMSSFEHQQEAGEFTRGAAEETPTQTCLQGLS